MAVFSTIGSIIAGNKQAKAIDKASDAQAAATQQAIGLQRDIYNQNVGFQTPLYNSGMAANSQINALLGLSAASPSSQSTQQYGPPQPANSQSEDQWAQSILNNAALRSEINPSLWAQVNSIQDPSDRLAALEPLMFRKDRQVYGQVLSSNPRPVAQAPSQQQPAQQVTQPNAESAYNAFKNYTGYTNRLAEGNNAINSAYAARGTIQSGAAMQELARYNQNFASNEFMNYMGLLSGQQQLASGAANALAGVGTNYANAAGNLAVQNGNNLANAAIARGNNSANTIGNIAGGFGNTAAFLASSFSDRRLKRDIEYIRTRKDGLNVYEWTYRNDPEQRRYDGFMADEVKEIYPEAYIANFNGTEYAGVNYAAIPREAA